MRLGSRGEGGARVCMCWDSQGGVRGGRSESEWVGIGRNRGFSDITLPLSHFILKWLKSTDSWVVDGLLRGCLPPGGGVGGSWQGGL